nr:glycosyl transferase family 2 [Candidatus Omnitrophota bacterium]
MKTLFWTSLFFVFYAYAGYLAVLSVIASFKKGSVARDDSYYPPVSLIIAAYNEEKAIEKK